MNFDELAPPSFPPRLATGAWVAIALVTASACWLLASPRGAIPGAAPVAVAIVLLEALSPRLGSFGFFSGSFPLLLLVSQSSLPLAVVSLVAGVLLRTLLRGHDSPIGRLLEALSDVLPGLCALAITQYLHRAYAWESPWWPSLIFALCWTFVPGMWLDSLDHATLKAWGGVRHALLWQTVGLACLAAILASSSTDRAALPGTVLICWGLMWSARSATEVIEARQEAVRQVEVEQRVDRQERTQAHVQRVQERSQRNLQVRLETYALIDRMLRSLPDEPAVRAIAHGLIEQVRIKLPCRSAALFLDEDRQLVLAAAVSPHLQKLQGIALTREHEPIVQRAYSTSRLETLRPADRTVDRLFPGELKAVAVPLRQQGVLYVGDDREGEYEPEQLEFLESLSEHAWLALKVARYQEGQKTALAREAEARAQMQALLGRLATVLEGLRELVLLKHPQAMLEYLTVLLGRLVPYDAVWLKFPRDELCRVPDPHDGLSQLMDAVWTDGRPLHFDDLRKTRFHREGSALKGVLAIPVSCGPSPEEGPSRSSRLGVLLIGSREDAYRTEDLDILSVVAYQMGASYQSVWLFADLEEAHSDLKRSQAQLIQSSKMAAVGQLAGGVAHELNSPLGAISVALGSALMVLSDRPDRAESRLRKALQSVEKMKGIIEKLLFYGRETSSDRRAVSLATVVQITLDLLGNQFHLENIEIETDLPDLPETLACQNEIQQILINLLLNAKDAVLGEGATARKIRISTALEDEVLVLSVRDWGEGIPPEALSRIFEPFYTTKDVGKGTGLGLSVSTELARQHDGRLDVISTVGQGTTFFLRIPLRS